jgi:hypothetical protein
MRTGVLLPHSLAAGSSHDLVSWARTAEDLGFDILGIRGRITHDSLEPLVALSLVAASTRRIELVLHVPALHLTQPRILARQIGGLDRASRGRLNVVVGAADDRWTFTDRDGRARCVAVVDLQRSQGAELDGVREALDVFERGGADDVLVSPPSGDLRALERLVGLRTAARV